MPQELFIGRKDWLIQTLQEPEPLDSNSRGDDPAIFGFPGPQHQTPRFQAIQEPGDIRIAGDHSTPNFAASQAGGPGPAQYSEYVILRGRELCWRQDFFDRAHQHIRRSLKMDQRFFSEIREGLELLYSALNFSRHPLRQIKQQYL